MSAVDQRICWMRWEHYHDTWVAEGLLGNSDVPEGTELTLTGRYSTGTHQTSYGSD